MNRKRLPQHLIEADIYEATSSRDCSVTGRECHLQDEKGAASDRVWAEYIQRCAETQSTDIFSTADWQGRFVDCCNNCNVYKEYKQQHQQNISFTQRILGVFKKNNERILDVFKKSNEKR